MPTNTVKAWLSFQYEKQIHVTDHVVFVLDKYAELLEKRYDENQQLDVVSIERLHKQTGDALVTHLQFHLEIFRQIQQQVIGHWPTSQHIS